MLQLREFLDENAHRSYPFKGSNKLPTELILDMHILISGVDTVLNYKDILIIEKVVVGATSMALFISYKSDTVLIQVGSFTVPLNNVEKTHSFSVAGKTILIDGSITVGYFDTSFIGTYNLGDDGLIFEGCVIPVTQWCTGLMVDGRLYTGIVNFQISDGLEVLASTDDEGNTNLDLRMKEYSSIQNEDIQSAVAAQFKATVDVRSFVKSINGVTPDSTGNIDIVIGSPAPPKLPSNLPEDINKFIAEDSYVNTLTIEATGNSTITIKDTQTKFCYNDEYFTIDDSTIKMLMENSEELTNRVQTIEHAIDSVENNLNTVNMQIVKMG